MTVASRRVTRKESLNLDNFEDDGEEDEYEEVEEGGETGESEDESSESSGDEDEMPPPSKIRPLPRSKGKPVTHKRQRLL